MVWGDKGEMSLTDAPAGEEGSELEGGDAGDLLERLTE